MPKKKTKLNTWKRYGENRYNDICMHGVSPYFRKLSGNTEP